MYHFPRNNTLRWLFVLLKFLHTRVYLLFFLREPKLIKKSLFLKWVDFSAYISQNRPIKDILCIYLTWTGTISSFLLSSFKSLVLMTSSLLNYFPLLVREVVNEIVVRSENGPNNKLAISLVQLYDSFGERQSNSRRNIL